VVSPPPEITAFDITPITNSDNDRLESIKLTYRLNATIDQVVNARLMLKVFYQEALLEEKPISLVNMFETKTTSDSLDYLPPRGWVSGLYAFQLELYDGETLVQSLEPQSYTVTPEAIAAVVKWQILGMIIMAAVAVAAIVVTIVVIRRRDMLHIS
jgi:hypothetical protein